ncbi:MAG TPA: hypothetical protein VL990_13295 [Acidobacteriaceae bacterium]|nr:hypothetical protein [Acidobacteriaceae bacterium]
MQPQSPVDAISPAFSRTRTILYPPGPAPGLNAPFRFWFFMRIALVAALTQGNIYGALFGIAAEALAVLFGVLAAVFGVAFHRTDSSFAAPHGFNSILVAAIVIAAVAAFLLVLLCIWLWCRFRFTLFDLVLYRHGVIARAWTPYRSQTWRFAGLMILVCLGLLLLFALTGGPLLLHLIVLFRHLSPRQIDSDPTIVFAHILPLYGIFFVFAIAAGIVNAIAQDFILPHLALEDASLDVAISRFFVLLRTRFWHLALYLLFRFVLELGIGMVGGLALFLVLAILGCGGAGLGFVLYLALWHAGPAGVTLFVLYCVLAGIAILAVYVSMIVALYGFIGVVKQSYAILFYSWYYPLLGDRLHSPAPVLPAGS